MIYIGDYFAIGLVIILFIFFFDNKTNLKNMPRSSKIFAVVLAMTAFNALIDLLTGLFLIVSGVPLWLNVLVNSLYFASNIVTTSYIALYLFIKILEHTHRKHCMRSAYIALSSILVFYLIVIIANIWTGVLFYFDSNGLYCRGPLNALGYYLIPLQMLFVLICYFRNKDTASRPMRRVLINVFPVIPVCILIQRLFPEIMLNSIIIAFVDATIFMTFMSHRHGVHALTELNDRHRFFDNVNYYISRKEPIQIFLINLKNFGAINQKYSHIVGDEFLYQFAFALEKKMKDGMAFHMNGTVFAVVMRYTYQSVAEKQSGELLDFLDNSIEFGDHHIEMEYILSHYISDGNETTSTDIFEIMEYSIAKGYGMKQKYIRCDQDICKEIERRRYLREKLKKIDLEHGFEVWYQPIKCLKTEKFSTMEALIRLRERDGSLISPAEFIPIAESTGQINSITWFVLEQTCKALKNNSVPEGTSVSINLPMSQLMEKGFATRFTGIVDQAGIDHWRICLEFTERTIQDNFTQTKNIMQEMTENGFTFYLDDFGQGYSNFNCMLQLPFKVIKFDSCLIHKNEKGEYNFGTIQALTKIFHEMDLTVVAEGAEKIEEVGELIRVGVDRIQGYVYSKPLTEVELLDFYKKLS